MANKLFIICISYLLYIYHLISQYGYNFKKVFFINKIVFYYIHQMKKINSKIY